MTDSIPAHLQQFVAVQDYTRRYSPRDHAVWRYTMHQLVSQLRETAHPVYFAGLEKTGISIERIPSIDEMNACLQKLGWRAVAVDGFIPPQAFMELQQNRILAIAQDMRSIEHVLYTPAPDIIHESAGHAPIIADEEYSEYLQRFGEVGVKAMYNHHDLALYEAIRQLSDLKAGDSAGAAEIAEAEQRVQDCADDEGQPSELALLGRLHWWTVEYGLVGTPENYRLFGAGLLSSLGEGRSCLESSVEKLPLTTHAILTPYDITRAQPQLFVTRSCRHLTQILEEYGETMCYQRGGADAVRIAVDSGVVTTCEYSSGLQVSGLFTRLIRNAIGREIYIGTSGPTQLCWQAEELEGHGVERHGAGFGSPVGRLCNLMKPLEEATEYDLQSLDICRESRVNMEFVSGIRVEGFLRGIKKCDHSNLLFSLTDCRVTDVTGEVLFDPAWGDYDMAVGERIRSVFPGSADRRRFEFGWPVAQAPADESSAAKSVSADQEQEFKLYQQVREMRESGAAAEVTLIQLYEKALIQAPRAWLLYLELLELAGGMPLAEALRGQLKRLAEAPGDERILIERGLSLLDNPYLAA